MCKSKTLYHFIKRTLAQLEFDGNKTSQKSQDKGNERLEK